MGIVLSVVSLKFTLRNKEVLLNMQRSIERFFLRSVFVLVKSEQ